MVSSRSGGGTRPQDATETWMLDLDSSHAAAEAWINGIPVARVSGDTLQTQVAVHEYLLPGKNKFQLIVEPGAGAKSFAHLRLMQMPQGSFPEDPAVKTHANLEFRPKPENPSKPPSLLQPESTP